MQSTIKGKARVKAASHGKSEQMLRAANVVLKKQRLCAQPHAGHGGERGLVPTVVGSKNVREHFDTTQQYLRVGQRVVRAPKAVWVDTQTFGDFVQSVPRGAKRRQDPAKEMQRVHPPPVGGEGDSGAAHG